MTSVLEGDIRKPYRESQLDDESVVSCRSLWALLSFEMDTIDCFARPTAGTYSDTIIHLFGCT